VGHHIDIEVMSKASIRTRVPLFVFVISVRTIGPMSVRV